MPARPSSEERLNDLETRFAFLERHVDALDRVLVERGEALDRLARELEALRARAAASAAEPDAGD